MRKSFDVKLSIEKSNVKIVKVLGELFDVKKYIEKSNVKIVKGCGNLFDVNKYFEGLNGNFENGPVARKGLDGHSFGISIGPVDDLNICRIGDGAQVERDREDKQDPSVSVGTASSLQRKPGASQRR